MKIIAINASPHKDLGCTARLLQAFLAGARETGAAIETFCAYDLRINPCLGCLACWNSPSGSCCQSDDMTALLPVLATADAWILATPVYADGMAGIMKLLLERSLSFLMPNIMVSGLRSRHPRNVSLHVTRMVLVATCGLWEIENFDPLILHIRALCDNIGVQLAGTLCRPHALFLRKAGSGRDSVLAAAREAGRQFSLGALVHSSLQERIRQPLVSLEKYVTIVNQCHARFIPVAKGGEILSTCSTR